MTQPPRKNAPVRNTGYKRKRARRTVGMMLGFIMAAVGAGLFFLSYSSNPPMLYTSFALTPLGLVIWAVSAIMRDRLNPPPNGNARP